MKRFNKLALAAAFGAMSIGAQASTLVYDFSGTVNLEFDPAYHSEQIISDYTAIFTEEAKFSTFYGQVILPNFENYATGTHRIGLNTNGIEVAIVSGLLGEIEGTSASVTAPNPNYLPGVANCTTRGGCDFDGDGVIETPRNNNPATVSVGSTFRPDATQQGDYGYLTVVDGKVTGFEWAAFSTNAGIVGTYNTRVFERQGWQTRIGQINVDLNGATASYTVGDVVFAANQSGVANVSMVPEADSYAMLLAGLGIVGAIARRRRNAAK